MLNFIVKFIVIGDGKNRDDIEKMVKKNNLDNNFIYLGKLEHSEAIKYYNAFDMVVYPRKNYQVCRSTSSSKIFEAMAMKMPIIVVQFLNTWMKIFSKNQEKKFWNQWII